MMRALQFCFDSWQRIELLTLSLAGSPNHEFILWNRSYTESGFCATFLCWKKIFRLSKNSRRWLRYMPIKTTWVKEMRYQNNQLGLCCNIYSERFLFSVNLFWRMIREMNNIYCMFDDCGFAVSQSCTIKYWIKILILKCMCRILID